MARPIALERMTHQLPHVRVHDRAQTLVRTQLFVHPHGLHVQAVNDRPADVNRVLGELVPSRGQHQQAEQRHRGKAGSHRPHALPDRHDPDKDRNEGDERPLGQQPRTERKREPAPAMAAKLAEIATAHAALPVPEGAGRAVGQKR